MESRAGFIVLHISERPIIKPETIRKRKNYMPGRNKTFVMILHCYSIRRCCHYLKVIIQMQINLLRSTDQSVKKNYGLKLALLLGLQIFSQMQIFLKKQRNINRWGIFFYTKKNKKTQNLNILSFC